MVSLTMRRRRSEPVRGRLSRWFVWQPALGQRDSFPWQATELGGLQSSGVSDSISTDLTTDPQGVGPGNIGSWSEAQRDRLLPIWFRGRIWCTERLGRSRSAGLLHLGQWLDAGQYYLRAWVFRYVQSDLDGYTFLPYTFNVGVNQWAEISRSQSIYS